MADGTTNGALPHQAQDVIMQDSTQPTQNGTPDLPSHDPLPPPRDTTPARPSSQPPPSAVPLPDKPAAHGAPTRVYLSQNVTPHLLEGMKYLAAYEPEKPLKWLSEFLAKKSGEVEG
ncbi:COMPASS component SDC1-like protein [Elsinoe fawcettii]|nr:COMPASS component SDC1-like protein [Elsinoe fawcettii]